MRGVLDIPPELSGLQHLLEDALVRVESRFDTQLRSGVPEVNELIEHLRHYRGKMLRPTLAVLSGMAGSGDETVTDGTVTAGACVEMIHMATLVHDDVLDEADTRRRHATVARLRGNETAVILGDHLFAAAYHLCAQMDDPVSARYIASKCMDVCAGELIQNARRDDLELDEDGYYEIVGRKTGDLTAAACMLGARHAGASESACAALEAFGRGLGIAFQIQDDVLDLTGQEDRVGKSVHKDLEKGKLTLPVIHHLQSAPSDARERTLDAIRAVAAGQTNRIGEILDALRETGSVEAAHEQAREQVRQAKARLDPLPATASKNLLILSADRAIDRGF